MRASSSPYPNNERAVRSYHGGPPRNSAGLRLAAGARESRCPFREMTVVEQRTGVMALEDRTADVVARRLAALGEPTRLKLVMALREREDASVHELAEAVGGTLPNVSKH